METGGFRGGYEDATLEKLAKVASRWSVNQVIVEGNFGDGMYLKLLSPILQKVHKCALEEVKSKGQKELRIADTLEPVLGSHKLVVNEAAITKDYQTARNLDGVHDINYSMFYQLTRLTRDRGALAHDDRLDALAIGVMYFLECMEKDSDKGVQEATEEFLMYHMKDPLKGFEDTLKVTIGGDLTVQWEQDEGLTEGSFIKW